MKTIYTVFSAAVIFLTAAGVSAEEYAVSGTVQYSGSSPMTDWIGKNPSVSGTVNVKQPGGNVCVRMTEWSSGNTKRDQHAADMFETARYSLSCLNIQNIKKSGEKTLVEGTLSLHGIEKNIVFTGFLKQTADGFHYEADGEVLLSDFSLKAPVIMGIRVDNRVAVHIVTEWKRKK